MNLSLDLKFMSFVLVGIFHIVFLYLEIFILFVSIHFLCLKTCVLYIHHYHVADPLQNVSRRTSLSSRAAEKILNFLHFHAQDVWIYFVHPMLADPFLLSQEPYLLSPLLLSYSDIQSGLSILFFILNICYSKNVSVTF